MTFPVLGTRARILSWAAIATIAVGACSSAATPVPPTPAPATPAPATSAPASVAPASSAPASPSPTASASPSEAATPETYTIAVATGSGSIGKFLTGDNGMTLYIFKKDTVGDGKSTCYTTCATNWPPFTLDEGEKAVGGTGASGKIATIARTDGKAQVTYNGAPLYYFAGDSKAGDTNGQALNNAWFVAAP
jgi:predicted lipoprotein with Yx(FWY)xxD motif